MYTTVRGLVVCVHTADHASTQRGVSVGGIRDRYDYDSGITQTICKYISLHTRIWNCVPSPSGDGNEIEII